MWRRFKLWLLNSKMRIARPQGRVILVPIVVFMVGSGAENWLASAVPTHIQRRIIRLSLVSVFAICSGEGVLLFGRGCAWRRRTGSGSSIVGACRGQSSWDQDILWLWIASACAPLGIWMRHVDCFFNYLLRSIHILCSPVVNINNLSIKKLL